MSKATPESVAASIEKIRKALDESAIVSITDKVGTITYVNDKFCQISQYGREELVGQNHRIINSGYHSPSFFKEMWRCIAKGNRWEGEVRNRAKDGSFYWVHTHIVPSFDAQGVINEFISIRYDITGRKESELNLSSLLDSYMDALFIYDLSARICWMNQTMRDQFDLSDSLKDLFVQDILGDDFQLFRVEQKHLTVGNRPQEKYFETNSKNYIFNKRAAYLVSLRDVTEKVRVETALLQQERLANVGVMASGLAHEIGTPLGVMRGRAEMWSLFPEASEVMKRDAEVIIQQIDRISSLVRSLLTLARGENLDHLSDVSVSSVLTKVQEFLTYELEQKNIKIEIQGVEQVFVKSSANALFQVFLNLIVNAIYAIEKKRKTSGHEIVGHLIVGAQQQGNKWSIHVQDNGIGIKEEDMKRLFTPFFTTKDIGQGTGLGLATSYHLVETWGGHISVQSQWTKGTTFILHLLRSEIL